MNNLFIPHAMMIMSHNNMMLQQHMDAQYLLSRRMSAPYSYNKNYLSEDLNENINYYYREHNYNGNDFGPKIEISPIFDDYEIIDIKNNKLLCYLKVDIKNKDTISLNCELKSGYMFEEDAENLFKKQIIAALKNGYIKITAVIGKNDEIAGKILEKLGFVINQEDKNGNS